MKWLSPSYWEIEGRLSSLTKLREEHTLEWARKMPEFHTWRTCVDMTSKERILWIRGSLGLGKTVMAGYFIELLKCHYPDAIVAYFFCRSGQAGLTKAREIICTLAYQCVQEDEEAQSVLEALRSKDFKIDENVGIGFLFDKLLREPLLKTSKEVFIVLDGLDEADRTSLDCTERRPVTEYEILLAHLGSLKTTRVLFISRPEANISRIIPHCITKQLGRDDNENDIDRYVRQKIEGSQRLRLHFANESIDPIQYFRDKANGIFLWVEIAIHQLSQAKSSSSFRKNLQGFSDASGSMERLYSSFLNRIEGDDVKWIKEILKWVVVYTAGSLPNPSPINSFLVDTLKEAVEFTLDDKLPEFQNFLEVEMGSLLHLIPSYDGIHAELIHETLKLFLSSPFVCPPAFLIDEETSHYNALVTCLEVLGDNNLPHIAIYAREAWPWHLVKLSSENIGAVDRIFHFLEGGGCKAWIGSFEGTSAPYQFLPHLSLNATRYEISLWMVHTFLMRFKSKLDTVKLVFDGSTSTPAHWITDMVSNPWKLGEYVGKAAAELCLFQDISYICVSFHLSLAIKYYCKRSGRHIDSPSDLKDLTLNNFSSIATWCGRSERPPNSNRIGTAFLTLRMWPEAVESLESGEDLDFNIWTWVGHAYMNLNEFEAAIRAYKRGIATCPESHLGVVREELWRYIGLANWTKGDFKSAIEVFEKTRFAHDVQPYNYDLPPSDPTDVSNVPQVYQTQESSREVKISDRYPIMLLASAYAAIGDHHGQLRICLGTSQRVNQWWAYQALESAYLSTSNRDYTSTVSDGVSKERAEINHLLHRQNSGHDTSELGTLSLDWLITGRRRQFSYHYPKPDQTSELI